MHTDDLFDKSKQQILSAMLLVVAAASVLVLTVNAINQRPWENLLFPGVLSTLVLGLHYLANRIDVKSQAFAKYAALVLLNVVYIPVSWLTSPGSTSAMPYYCIAIFIFGLMLTSRFWEYIFPAITVMEVMVMLQIEAQHPQWFDIYTDPVYRLFDLTVNYLVASGIIFMMVFIILQHYKRHNRALYRMSITDTLTGLYNRRYMMSSLEHAHNASLRTGLPYSIAMIDIDNFKKVNDGLGHLEGDSVLRAVSTILLNESRNYDICCRYGGDEFLVILPHTGREEVKAYTDRIQERFNEFAQRYKEFEVRLSIGFSERGEHTLDEMIEIADNVLYQHKRSQV